MKARAASALATPTAAAELAAPERAALQNRLLDLRNALAYRIARRLEAGGQRLDLLARRLVQPVAPQPQQASLF